MNLEYGKTYRARNGQIFTLELMGSSYFLDRPEHSTYPFCAQRGQLTWQADGKYGLSDFSFHHALDLVEELPTNYKMTEVESLTAELAAAKQKIANEELDEYVVVKLPKWQLMFITAVIGGSSPHYSFQKVLGTYSNEIRDDVHFKALCLKIQEMDAHVVYEALLDIVNQLDDKKV